MAFTAGYGDPLIAQQGGFPTIRDAQNWLTDQIEEVIATQLGGSRSKNYFGLAAVSIGSFPAEPFEYTSPGKVLFFVRQEQA